MKFRIIIFSTFLLLFFAAANKLEASTVLTQKIIDGNSNMQAASGPYIISSSIEIPVGKEVNFEKGSILQFKGGSIKVAGTLNLNGDSGKMIAIDNSVSGQADIDFNLNGGKINLNFVFDISGVGQLIESSGGNIEITHSHFENIAGARPLIEAYNNSSISLADAVFNRIKTPEVFEIYNNAHADIRQVAITQSGKQSAVSIYDGGNVSEHSSMSFIDSSIDQSPSKGLEVYNGAILDLQGTSVTNSLGTGLVAYSNGNIVASNISLEKNSTGLEVYNATAIISESSIDGNLNDGVIAYGGNVSVLNNWWGSISGPKNQLNNPFGAGQRVSDEVLFKPWLKERPIKKTCCSSILFIPGIEASRLYEKGWTENQLWEPNTNADVKKLFLDNNGASINKDIYTRDIIGKTNITGGLFDVSVYDGLTDFLKTLVSKGIISSWNAAPYDWRIAADNIATQPIQLEKNATTSLQILFNSLLKTSKTGKVSILAHSNGGLVAKQFIKNLFDQGTGNLVDHIIMVGVPEYGAPQTIDDMLHGDSQSILNGLILSKSTARNLTKNMPAAYGLLPSEKFLDAASTPVISFSSDSDPSVNPASIYGSAISGEDQLDRFLTAFQKDRVDSSSIDQPAVLSREILTQAEKLHDKIDNWLQSSSSQLLQLADVTSIIGIGRDTIAGMQYKYSKKDGKTIVDRARIFSNDGDGVVLAGPPTIRSGNVYSVDIAALNLAEKQNYQHSNIMNIPEVQQMISSIVQNNISTLPLFISKVATSSVSWRRYEFAVHSPVSIMAYDQNGKRTGLVKEATDDVPGYSIEEIPNSSYDDFGEAKTVIMDSLPAKIVFTGLDEGTFTFTAAEYENNNMVSHAEYSDIPVLQGMSAQFIPASSSIMTIDYNNDGVTDQNILPDNQSSEIDLNTAIINAESVINSEVKIGLLKSKYIRELEEVRELSQKGSVNKAAKELKQDSENFVQAMKIYNFIQNKLKIKKLVEPIVRDTTVLFYQFQRLDTIASKLVK